MSTENLKFMLKALRQGSLDPRATEVSSVALKSFSLLNWSGRLNLNGYRLLSCLQKIIYSIF